MVVCTHNGAGVVGDAIDSLRQQSCDPSAFEILVVDNASVDDTAAVVRERSEDRSVRYIFEPRLGLGSARNRGWREARSPYIGYMDDDARADHNLLANALELLTGPRRPVCVGGRILPSYTSPPPAWFKDEYETRSWGSSARALEIGESFSGSNMFWRRDVLEAYGGFSTERGMRGSHLAIGEETSLFHALWTGPDDPCFLYSPDLIVYHRVPHWKFSTLLYVKRALATGRDTNQDLQSEKIALRRARYALRAMRELVRAARSIPRHRQWQRWVYEECWGFLVAVGALLASVGIRIRFRARPGAAA
jgi:glycosyltransferase involved in cell wall biosynthesis